MAGGSRSQRMISRFDLVHPPQYWIEGTGPSNYARNGIKGKGIAPFQVGKMTINNSPEFVDNMFAGQIDRQGVVKVWEENTVTVSGRIINGTTGWQLLQWAAQKPPLTYTDSKNDTDENRKPHQSRTWIYSFQNSENKIVYLVAKGCKPQNCKITFSNKAIAMMELTMACKSVISVQGDKPTDLSMDATNFSNTTRSTYGLESGSGSGKVQFELNEPCERPLRFQDLGRFLYKNRTNNLAFESLDLGVDWSLRRQNSNGSDRSLFLDHAGRSGTGSVSLYKEGNELNEDARTDNLHYAWVELGQDTDDDDDDAEITVAGTGGSLVNFIANAPGTLGNGHEIVFNAAATANSESTNKLIVTSAAAAGRHKITVTPKFGGDTWANLATFINNHCQTTQIGRIVLGAAAQASATKITAAITKKVTAGGTDGVSKLVFSNFKFQPSWEDLIDQSEATIENKSIQADTIDVVVV